MKPSKPPFSPAAARTDAAGRPCACHAPTATTNPRALSDAQIDNLIAEARRLILNPMDGKLAPRTRELMIAELARLDGPDPAGFWSGKSNNFVAGVYHHSACRERQQKHDAKYNTEERRIADAKRDLPAAREMLRDANRGVRHYTEGGQASDAIGEGDRAKARKIADESHRLDRTNVDDGAIPPNPADPRAELAAVRSATRDARRKLRHLREVAELESIHLSRAAFGDPLTDADVQALKRLSETSSFRDRTDWDDNDFHHTELKKK
jgi:hypothetical protein